MQPDIDASIARGRMTEARELARSWVSREPQNLLAQQYLGLAQLWCGDALAAEESFRSALALAPDLARNQANLAISLLSQGRYIEGLPLYEARYGGVSAYDGVRFAGLDPARQWHGEALQRRRLLLVREQGFGDQIQFIRFVPQVRERGAGRVIVSTSVGLATLLSSMDGVDLATEDDISKDDYDLWCPLMSLPLVLGIEAPQSPLSLPYLHAPDARVLQWRRTMEGWTQGRAALGIVWAGSPGNSVDVRRSLPTGLMLDMVASRRNMTAISLQMGAAGMDRIEQQVHAGIIPVLDMLKDFADTAALVEQLDLVITVDTAVAHLAGALGKPVWLMLPAGPDWRWGTRGETTPWYPSVRLFRQAVPGDWSEVAARIFAALQAMDSSP